MTTRTDRIRNEYSDPNSNPCGAARDQKNLDFWADRAATNSQLPPRAKSSMMLPDTAKTEKSDSGNFTGDARKVGKQQDHAKGTNFMPNVRRQP